MKRITNLDVNILPDARPDAKYTDWRDVFLTELESYMAEIVRFATRKEY